MSPAAARQQRWRAISRIRALEAASELRIDEIVAEIAQHLPVPAALLASRRNKLQREHDQAQQKLDKLCAQVAAQRVAIAAIVAQEAELAAVAQRERCSPYVEGLWTDLRQAFDQEGANVARALARWRQLERRLSAGD